MAPLTGFYPIYNSFFTQQFIILTLSTIFAILLFISSIYGNANFATLLYDNSFQQYVYAAAQAVYTAIVILILNFRSYRKIPIFVQIAFFTVSVALQITVFAVPAAFQTAISGLQIALSLALALCTAWAEIAIFNRQRVLALCSAPRAQYPLVYGVEFVNSTVAKRPFKPPCAKPLCGLLFPASLVVNAALLQLKIPALSLVPFLLLPALLTSRFAARSHTVANCLSNYLNRRILMHNLRQKSNPGYLFVYQNIIRYKLHFLHNQLILAENEAQAVVQGACLLEFGNIDFELQFGVFDELERACKVEIAAAFAKFMSAKNVEIPIEIMFDLYDIIIQQYRYMMKSKIVIQEFFWDELE
eukprot:EST41930.1 Transmembrane domain-containing protein [Spironucleus salmonicida]